MPTVYLNLLPNELWIAIFESLSNPSDISRVARACKRFCDLAIRILYRHIIWDDPRRFVTNYPFLRLHPELNSVPRSLTLGISRLPHRGGHIDQLENIRAIVDEHGQLQRPPLNHESAFDEEYLGLGRSRREAVFVASFELYNILRDCFYMFSMLSELNFKNVLLPDDCYVIIHYFPYLRKLQIDHCTLPWSPTGGTIPHRMLPITELTLLGLRGHRDTSKALTLATAENLRILRFDWTAPVFRTFTDSSIDDKPSPCLEIIDAKFPPQKRWPSNPTDVEELYIAPFKAFLAMCPSVTRLRIRNHFPTFTLTPDILPHLAYYQGPLATVGAVSAGRPVIALDIRDPSGSLRNLTSGLQAVAANQSDLQELYIFLYQWDNEILYAIQHHFTHLRKLQIRYFRGSPSEDMILGMGPRFFYSFARLHTAHIFKTLCDPDERQNLANLNLAQFHHEMFLTETVGETEEDNEGDYEVATSHTTPSDSDAEEDELKSLILAWNRYCPSMREIQLMPGFVWRRSHEKDEWCKRKYKLVESERDYSLVN